MQNKIVGVDKSSKLPVHDEVSVQTASELMKAISESMALYYVQELSRRIEILKKVGV